MDIVSPSALPVGSLIWEPRPGERMLTVCVKATFSLVNGQTSALSPQQEPIHADIPWGDAPGASLYAPSDFVPTKPRVDILLSGHAHAPGQRPVEHLVARVAVDEFSKSLLVRGAQRWARDGGGLRPGPAQPFVRMPLRYDQGGLREDEPGFTAMTSPAPGAPLPHFDRAPGAPGVDVPPGFGPLSPAARALRTPGGQDVMRWAESLSGRARVAPPPQVDWALFNSAPRDQQIAALGPAPRIALENLHPTIVRLETRLPAVAPRAFHIAPGAGQPTEIRLRCDTLRIDTDRGRAILSYRGTFPLGRLDERALGVLGVLLEGEGATLGVDDLLRLMRARAGIGAGAGAGAGGSEPAQAEEEEVGASTVMGAPLTGAPVLPFASAPPGALPRIARSTPNPAGRAPVIRSSEPQQASPLPDGGESEVGGSTLPIAAPSKAPAMPFGMSEGDAEVGGSTLPIGQPLTAPALPFSAAHAAPAFAPPVEPAPAEPPPAPEAPREPLPLALCAAALAEQGVAKDPEAALRARGISEDDLALSARHWADAMAAEARRDRFEMTHAYDDAYIAALEKARGKALDAEAYAKLSIGIERGDARAALAELGLPPEALFRIERVWTRKTMNDSALDAEVEAAVARIRGSAA